MSEEIKIKVFEVVGDELCVASSDGEKLYRRIHPFLKRGKKIVLSFSNISTITSAFFNSSIAPLYGDFDAELIRDSIVLEDMTDDDKLLLKRVADNAKRYYKDPEAYEREMLEAIKD